jgi:uncharacterized membrane protein YfcA
MTPRIKGILLMVASMVIFTLLDAAAKHLVQTLPPAVGMNPQLDAAEGRPIRRIVFVVVSAPRPEGAPVVPAPDIGLTTVVKVLAAGSLVGVLTGFFGVGGGFVIVPALVLALGFSMPDAVGTSLLVIVVNSLVALSTRFNGGTVDWGAVVPFTVASVIGVFVGSRLAARRDPRSLQGWFVGLLVIVALYTAGRSIAALT